MNVKMKWVRSTKGEIQKEAKCEHHFESFNTMQINDLFLKGRNSLSQLQQLSKSLQVYSFKSAPTFSGEKGENSDSGIETFGSELELLLANIFSETVFEDEEEESSESNDDIETDIFDHYYAHILQMYNSDHYSIHDNQADQNEHEEEEEEENEARIDSSIQPCFQIDDALSLLYDNLNDEYKDAIINNPELILYYLLYDTNFQKGKIKVV